MQRFSFQEDGVHADDLEAAFGRLEVKAASLFPDRKRGTVNFILQRADQPRYYNVNYSFYAEAPHAE